MFYFYLLILIILVLLLCPSKFRKKNTISNNFDPVICTRDVGPDLDLNSLQSEQRDGTSRWPLQVQLNCEYRYMGSIM